MQWLVLNNIDDNLNGRLEPIITKAEKAKKLPVFTNRKDKKQEGSIMGEIIKIWEEIVPLYTCRMEFIRTKQMAWGKGHIPIQSA